MLLMRMGCGLSTTAITSTRLSNNAARLVVSRSCRLNCCIKGMPARSSRATVWVETAEFTPGASEYLPHSLAVRQPDDSSVRSSRKAEVFDNCRRCATSFTPWVHSPPEGSPAPWQRLARSTGPARDSSPPVPPP